MQGRVREGGDHLAALTNDSKGHTSFSACRARSGASVWRPSCCAREAASAPAKAASRCSRSFPRPNDGIVKMFALLHARSCAFATEALRAGGSGGPETRRIILTTCNSRIKNNIYLKTTISAVRGLTTLVLFKEDVR